MKKNGLISGALILSVGAMLAKVFSAIYRIALTRILGGEGIGLYQLIFPFYSLCVIFATAGLPMAISKVVSKHKDQDVNILKKCILFTSSIAIIATFILCGFSSVLAGLQGEKGLYIFYIILSPTILIISFSSVLRGYFQGKHKFYPSSISNIIEQFVKFVVGLILCLLLVKISLIAAIVGAVVSIVLSETVSLIVLVFYFRKEKLTKNSKCTISLKGLLRDIVPITLNNLILPISSFIDSVLVVNLLNKNFSQGVSVFLYGLESGAVSSLVSLPTIFSFALASVILPNIITARNNFNRNEKLSTTLKIVFIITVPCALCFALIPNRLISVLYGNRLIYNGLDGMVLSSRLLSISSLGIVFLAVNQIYSSCLQGIDERMVVIRNLIIAVVVKFIIEIIFMPSKLFNIYGLVAANVVCYVTVAVLNHFEIREKFKVKIHYSFWAKLIFSNCVMIFSLLSILCLRENFGNTLLGLVVACLVYFFCLFWTKILSSKDKAIIKYKL